MRRTEHELRCLCSSRVLLAMYGKDTDGRGYLHIKARKAGRIITNTLHKGGEHDLWCSACQRVTRIYLTPRGSRVVPPTREIPEMLIESDTITLPVAANPK